MNARLSVMTMCVLAGTCVPAGSAAAQLAVSSALPAINANNVPRDGTISITFDRAVDRSTVTPANFNAFGKWSGPVTGPLTFSNGDRTVTLTPTNPMVAGENVMVVLSNRLRGADNSTFRSAGYTVTFTVAASRSAARFCHLNTFSTQSGAGETHIYGGLACDLNLDRWPDLTIVNEVSADLRVYLNTANGSGLFGPLQQPVTSIPVESSPNEPADFNGDGFVDIVASSNATNEISISMGRGNGLFDPAVIIAVGQFPRGFGVMDVDGDGDLDITVANRTSNVVSVLRNNGAGVFQAPTTFATTLGGSGPYGMTAADMNNDGIMDLVIGYVQSQTVGVYLGNGNGTFTFASSRPFGGGNWVIVCGDINNDGKMDVSGANSFSNNGSIVKGNGDGTLQPVTTYANGGHTTATDLADLDGDGDLDWIISSYGSSAWFMYLNDGNGNFTLARTFAAPGNPACCLPADTDNDGDVDLILLDETTDLVLMYENSCYANCDCSTASPQINALDFSCFLGRFQASDPYANCDNSTTPPTLNALDFSCFLTQFRSGCT